MAEQDVNTAINPSNDAPGDQSGTCSPRPDDSPKGQFKREIVTAISTCVLTVAVSLLTVYVTFLRNIDDYQIAELNVRNKSAEFISSMMEPLLSNDRRKREIALIAIEHGFPEDGIGIKIRESIDDVVANTSISSLIRVESIAIEEVRKKWKAGDVNNGNDLNEINLRRVTSQQRIHPDLPNDENLRKVFSNAFNAVDYSF